MNRAESLALLRTWATNTRNAFARPVTGCIADYSAAWRMSADAARSHGLSAVRAIRAVPFCPYCVEDSRIGSHREPDAISESSLAFRAALSAVGIKGAL